MPAARAADLGGRSYCCYSSSVLAFSVGSRKVIQENAETLCALLQGLLAESVESVVSRGVGGSPVNWAKSSVNTTWGATKCPYNVPPDPVGAAEGCDLLILIF
ncbi:hypothetical protein D9M68_983650 [compost metagenome]